MTYKRADLATIFPAVAAPALGAFGGRALGMRYPTLGPELGALVGGITGGTSGQLLREKIENARNVPPGAPYNIDATSADIPPWALTGAQLLQPAMKQANHFGPIVGGDLLGLGYPVAAGIHEKKPAGGILRDVAGQGLGTLGGGIAGHLAGGAIDKLVGHSVNVPGVNVSLTDILAGLGATIGNVKGLNLAQR